MPHPLTANTLVTTVDINASLQRFWEIEDNTDHKQQDPSHEKVEQHFLTTRSRDPDGSFEDVNGHALNDALHFGLSIRRNLFHVCFRFRMYKFVFSADIVKMFRQIWVAPKHRNFQHFQLCTVTYGTSCAPFLAVRVLEQLARDHQDEFPTASKIVLEDFYVDDVLTGAETGDELLSRRDELIQLMSKAKLELGKWVSNSSRLSRLSRTRQGELPITSAVKVLGMH
ncbi:uncharacterized protein [Drosophila takahashii]|uniref:uncharacterized protein n=1 Tax=Drosophila takahashii TaxID=29030 RepID=UPI0038993897